MLAAIKRFVAELALLDEFRHAEILAVNQFVQADFKMVLDGRRFSRPLRGDFGKERIERRGQRGIVRRRCGRATRRRRERVSFRRKGQIEENGRLADGHCAVCARPARRKCGGEAGCRVRL